MTKPDLKQLAHWIDPPLVVLLERRRYQKKEWRRHRKLGTQETLWLMLAVSLDTERSSLYEILRLATAHLFIAWSIYVAAFCKARAHFSPRRPDGNAIVSQIYRLWRRSDSLDVGLGTISAVVRTTTGQD